MGKRTLLISIAIIGLVSAGLIYNYKNSPHVNRQIQLVAKYQHSKMQAFNDECFKGSIAAVKTWQLPAELTEISGISWIDKDRVAAIQDNDGIIFIYNFHDQKIERQLNFGKAGDHEGIACVGKDYFVIRSDGYMYEINKDGKILHEYTLPLSTKDNIESFYFEAAENRLLIGQKDGMNKAIKEIYSFNLGTRKLDTKPLYSIDLSLPIFTCNSANDKHPTTIDEIGKKGKKEKKKVHQKPFKPSELAIHPKTKDIYMADGPNQRILVLSANATPQYFLSLDRKLFPQVEGIMFSPDGDLYISTEGRKGSANISLVSITLK